MMNGSRSATAMQIVYIPGKLPIPPDQQPTVDVYASVIEPKLAHVLVRRLNQIAPMENYRHVKRIHKKSLGGDANQSICMSSEVQELVNSYQLSPLLRQVCKCAASSKEEWEEQCKLWPTSYHPPTYNIEGITGFNEEDSQSVFGFMKSAVDLAKSNVNLMLNAAIIVDPSNKQIIASACDQTNSWLTPSRREKNENGSIEKSEEISSSPLDSCGVASHKITLPSALSDKSLAASCLDPRGWSRQRFETNPHYWHPLRHAAIVAVEVSAARDKHLYPGTTTNAGVKHHNAEDIHSSSVSSQAKKQRTDIINDVHPKDSGFALERPYLCTGYDIYLVWEPCIMCAMALVHQRIRRIFYAFPNAKAGALGSVHRLQGEKSLNHHYAVFRVFLPEQTVSEFDDKDSKHLTMH